MAQSILPVCCSAPLAEWPFICPLPGVHLHSCSFDPADLSPDAFSQAGIPAPENILRAIAKRQTEFLAGRLCARAALASLGQQPLPADLDEEGTPLWPSGLTGSITHSHGLAAAVAGNQQSWLSLGLDAEILMPAARATRLAAQILTPAELQSLHSLPEAERAGRVSLTFCSKESLFKALYPLVRQRFYFQDAELLDAQPEGQLQLRLLRDLSPQWPQGSLIQGQHTQLGQHLLSLVCIARQPALG